MRLFDWLKTHMSTILKFIGIVVVCAVLQKVFGPESEYSLFISIILFCIMGYILYRKLFIGEKTANTMKYMSTCLLMVVFTNHLHNYHQLISTFPFLEIFTPIQLLVVVLGIVFGVVLLAKLIIFALNTKVGNQNISNQSKHSNNADHNPGQTTQKGTSHSKQDKEHVYNEPNATHSKDKIRNIPMQPKTKIHRDALAVTGLTLIIIIGGILLYLKVLQSNENLTKLATTGLIPFISACITVMIIIAVIITLFSSVLGVVKFFYRWLKTPIDERQKPNTTDLRGISVMLTGIIGYIGYISWGKYDLNNLFDTLTSNDFLAVPLTLVGILAAMIVLFKLVLALLEVITLKHKEGRLSEAMNAIVTDIFDILFDAIMLVLRFIKFIPDFFILLYASVQGENIDTENSDSSKSDANIKDGKGVTSEDRGDSSSDRADADIDDDKGEAL